MEALAAERLPDSVIAKGFMDRTIAMPCTYGFPDHDITEVTNPMGEGKFIELLQELEKVRNILLIYRIQHHDGKFADIPLNIIGREKQLFKPILRIYNKHETQKDLRDVISNHINERQSANVDSLHAFVYRMVNELISKTKSIELSSKEVWTQVHTNLSGEFLYKGNTTFESVEFGHLTQRKITKICKKVLGATLNRDMKERKFVFNQKKLDHLDKLFNLSLEVKDMTDMRDMTHSGMDKYVGGTEGSGENESMVQKTCKILTFQIQIMKILQMTDDSGNLERSSKASYAS